MQNNSSDYLVELQSKNSQTYFKFIDNSKVPTKIKTLTPETLYNILGNLLQKESVLYDTGYVPKSLVRVSETNSAYIFEYHYDKIIYDLRVNSYELSSYNLFSNVEIIEENLSNDRGSLWVLKNLELPELIIKFTVNKLNSHSINFKIYHRVPFNSFGSHILTESDILLPFSFPNYFSRGSFCWGRNTQLEEMYRCASKEELDDRPKLYQKLNNMIYSYLNTLFNSDLSGNFAYTFLNYPDRDCPAMVELSSNIRSYYGREQLDENSDDDDDFDDNHYIEISGTFTGALLFNYLAKHPEDYALLDEAYKFTMR